MTAVPPLRRAEPADAPAIAALVNRAYEKYVPRIGRKPRPMTADYDAAVTAHQMWVFEVGGVIVAALELIPEKEVLLIENIAVDPAQQGTGLGKLLLAFAEDEARRQGFAALRLYTNEKMTENIAIYARFGYRTTGRRTRRGFNVVFMRKELSGVPPLRRARPADATAIAQLVNRAYAKYLPRIGQPPLPMVADYSAVIRQHDVWVLESDGVIIAALVLIAEPDVLLLDNIAVDPAHQGSGLGRKLMAFVESEALRQGFASIRLYTNEKMAENIAFYDRLDYRETGREVLNGRHAVHMRKELSGA